MRAPAAPDISNQRKHECYQKQSCNNCQDDDYAHRIDQDELAAPGVEAVEAADGVRERE